MATLTDTRCLLGGEFGGRKERNARHAGGLGRLPLRDSLNAQVCNVCGQRCRRGSVTRAAAPTLKSSMRSRSSHRGLASGTIRLGYTRRACVGRRSRGNHRFAIHPPAGILEHTIHERLIPAAAEAPNGDEANERARGAEQGRGAAVHRTQRYDVGTLPASGAKAGHRIVNHPHHPIEFVLLTATTCWSA